MGGRLGVMMLGNYLTIPESGAVVSSEAPSLAHADGFTGRWWTGVIFGWTWTAFAVTVTIHTQRNFVTFVATGEMDLCNVHKFRQLRLQPRLDPIARLFAVASLFTPLARLVLIRPVENWSAPRFRPKPSGSSRMFRRCSPLLVLRWRMW